MALLLAFGRSYHPDEETFVIEVITVYRCGRTRRAIFEIRTRVWWRIGYQMRSWRPSCAGRTRLKVFVNGYNFPATRGLVFPFEAFFGHRTVDPTSDRWSVPSEKLESIGLECRVSMPMPRQEEFVLFLGCVLTEGDCRIEVSYEHFVFDGESAECRSRLYHCRRPIGDTGAINIHIRSASEKLIHTIVNIATLLQFQRIENLRTFHFHSNRHSIGHTRRHSKVSPSTFEYLTGWLERDRTVSNHRSIIGARRRRMKQFL